MEYLNYLLHIDLYLEQIIAGYGTATYAILFLIIFCETGLVVTPFLPGDTLLFAGGMFVATGSFNFFALTMILWIAAAMGDSCNYWIGRLFGKNILEKKKILKPQHIAHTKQFFAKHGGWAIFFARFLPVLRTLVPFFAGVNNVRYRRFVSYSITGGFTWVFSIIACGYLFGNMPLIRDNFSLFVILVIALLSTPSVVGYIRSKRMTK